jgi:hypothetical protein
LYSERILERDFVDRFTDLSAEKRQPGSDDKLPDGARRDDDQKQKSFRPKPERR